MCLVTPPGHCLGESFNPANGSQVVREVGAVNVSFECIVVDANGNQTLTQWNIENYRGVSGVQDISIVPNTILTGEPTNTLPGFSTFRSRLIFSQFLSDFDGATLVCGTPLDFMTGQFPLRVYRECSYKRECPVLLEACFSDIA